uniref:F-box domain-containing protein n=1 Tax=Brassica campestris TaxID=3711 RepID=M4DZ42_BRACM
MKPQRQNVREGGLTISLRVMRSMIKLHQNSLLLPDDLILEIFSRLPSKFIARCRCLSKLWASTLRDQDFQNQYELSLQEINTQRVRYELKSFQNDNELYSRVSAMQPPRQNVSKGGELTNYRGVTRSMTRRHRNSLPVPDDLAMEIFSRLPPKAVARCRCACKLWSSILRRQDFTALFLTKSCARPQLLFAREDRSVSKYIFISSPQPGNPQENAYVVAANHLARFPRSNGFYGCTCTSGFFCYGDDRNLKGLQRPVHVPVICNPSTGQSLTMPRLISKKRYGVQSYLGYEPIEKELKLLSMNNSLVSDEWISVEHQVLTLGTKKLSWRLVECCIPHRSSSKWICISGVLYYAATAAGSSENSMVVCFDLRSEKFSSVKFGKAMPDSTTLVNYDGKLGLLMSGDSHDVSGARTSFELWVVRDAAKHEWFNHIYVLPPSWEDVVSETMYIAGMIGTNEIVFSPSYQRVPYYVIYFNVERKTITKVGIQGLEAFHGGSFHTYLNYVQNVKLL